MKTLKCIKSTVAASTIFFALLHGSAYAAVDFNLAPTNSPSLPPGSSIIWDGYKFSSSSNSALVNGNNYLSYGVSNGTTMLVFDGVIGSLTVSRVDNGFFALSSLDVGGWLNLPANSGAKMSFTGFTGSAGVVTSESLSLSSSSFENFIVGSSFTNLSSLTMKISGYTSSAYVAIDNLILTPVPEAETYAMMLAGLGLLSLVARRKTGKTA